MNHNIYKNVVKSQFVDNGPRKTKIDYYLYLFVS